jgi:hypothetical protein
MRYLIGSKVQNDCKKIIEGFYGYGKYGIPEIITRENQDESFNIVVFNSLDEAKEYISSLSKGYYFEFSKRIERYNLDRNQFKFFLVKLDSSKCPIKLTEKYEYKSKSKKTKFDLYKPQFKKCSTVVTI